MPNRPDDVISIDGDDPYWLRSKLPGAPKSLKKLGGKPGSRTKSVVRLRVVSDKDVGDE